MMAVGGLIIAYQNDKCATCNKDIRPGHHVGYINGKVYCRDDYLKK